MMHARYGKIVSRWTVAVAVVLVCILVAVACTVIVCMQRGVLPSPFVEAPPFAGIYPGETVRTGAVMELYEEWKSRKRLPENAVIEIRRLQTSSSDTDATVLRDDAGRPMRIVFPSPGDYVVSRKVPPGRPQPWNPSQPLPISVRSRPPVVNYPRVTAFAVVERNESHYKNNCLLKADCLLAIDVTMLLGSSEDLTDLQLDSLSFTPHQYSHPTRERDQPGQLYPVPSDRAEITGVHQQTGKMRFFIPKQAEVELLTSNIWRLTFKLDYRNDQRLTDDDINTVLRQDENKGVLVIKPSDPIRWRTFNRWLIHGDGPNDPTGSRTYTFDTWTDGLNPPDDPLGLLLLKMGYAPKELAEQKRLILAAEVDADNPKKP